MATPPAVTGRVRTPIIVVAGACLGYLAGGIVRTAVVGGLSETVRRLAYGLQGGRGETANWGEPLYYVLLLAVLPGVSTLGGALIGITAASMLSRSVDSAGGALPFARRHALALGLTWLVLVQAVGLFVYVQWRNARAEVARYREITEPEPGIKVDPQFLASLERDCDAGKAGACTFAGQTYEYAQGVPRDLRRALANYRKGCDHGHAAACASVGGLYDKGETVGADPRAALEFYQRGCDGGYAEACRNIALLRQKGTSGTPGDPARSAVAFNTACDAGDGWSCYTLGLMHERAQGTPRDYARAAEYYGKACAVRYAMGCQYLGDSYSHGEGVARDDARGRVLYVEAAGLLEKDCAGRDAYSCFALGIMYRQGQGVPVDVAKARDSLARACSGGYDAACVSLRALP